MRVAIGFDAIPNTEFAEPRLTAIIPTMHRDSIFIGESMNLPDDRPAIAESSKCLLLRCCERGRGVYSIRHQLCLTSFHRVHPQVAARTIAGV